MKDFSEQQLFSIFEFSARSLGASEEEIYEFARCMRPDGSFYGTRGKCKKGTEAKSSPQLSEENVPKNKEKLKKLRTLLKKQVREYKDKKYPEIGERVLDTIIKINKERENLGEIKPGTSRNMVLNRLRAQLKEAESAVATYGSHRRDLRERRNRIVKKLQEVSQNDILT